nr:putative RNA-dependent RNA polymerase [Salvia hispanica RNA virus 1]
MKGGGRIPTSRSKFEAKVRRVIGGGEMRNWAKDSNMYRGGGNYSDALKLLATARTDIPGSFLHKHFTVNNARSFLKLPCGLPVPVGPESVRMKNFNEEATAGPSFRAFGIYRKKGLKAELEATVWKSLHAYAEGGDAESCLPFIAARVGYRSKLLTLEKAFSKLASGECLGRCVMMLDAFEQTYSSALYNVISGITHRGRHNPGSSFRNTTVRASSDWGMLFEEVKKASAVIELDWKKFDRDRPSDDIYFVIDIILSCFQPKNGYEARLLEAHGIMLRRALVERPFITDDGGIFTIEGMVPSGSLWTGWLDTALNTLYIKAVLFHLGFRESDASPKCAGDDNLTLIFKEATDMQLMEVKRFLNEWFRAGIDDEDFMVHRPPYHVERRQAVFPPGTDLSKGTSKLLDLAQWVPFEDPMTIDESKGLSHRWKYIFENKPKFLSCYWDENNNPIRPAYINLEKLLWPEGIHETIEDYEAALIGMVVDNPFNHHNVNHLMHRYCIVQQVKRMMITGIKAEDVLDFCRFKDDKGEGVPFPMVAQWRRVNGWVDMEKLPFVDRYIAQFRDFVTGVTSLYSRSPTGGLDSWRFMDIIRGVGNLNDAQFGNDMVDWVTFLKGHPLTKYLKPTKGSRKRKLHSDPEEEALTRFKVLNHYLDPTWKKKMFDDVDSYALWISDLLRNKGPTS